LILNLHPTNTEESTIKSRWVITDVGLRKISSQVVDFGQELQEIIVDLKETFTHLQEKMKIGRALAAPQIGYLKQVIYSQSKDFI
jgi:peptide deformylase